MTSARTAFGIGITAASLLTMPNLVRAQETEWRLIGPAASWHSHTVGAPTSTHQLAGSCSLIPGDLTAGPRVSSYGFDVLGSRAEVERTTVVSITDVGRQLLSMAPCDGLPRGSDISYSAAGKCRDLPAGYMMTSAVMRIDGGEPIPLPHHTQHGPYVVGYECDYSARKTERRWHERHLALGVERVVRHEHYADRAFAQVIQDSYGRTGVMTGVGRTWPLASIGTVTFSGGVAAGLWYRTLRDDDTHELRRRVLPYALPVLAIEEAWSGLGLYASVAPGWSVGGYGMPTTVMLQSSMRVYSSARHSVSAGIEVTPSATTVALRGRF